jgi:hypothetical protein
LEDDWFSLFPLYPIKHSSSNFTQRIALSKQQNHTKQMIFTFKMFWHTDPNQTLTAFWIIESSIKEINCPKTDLVENTYFTHRYLNLQLKITMLLRSINLASYRTTMFKNSILWLYYLNA